MFTMFKYGMIPFTTNNMLVNGNMVIGGFAMMFTKNVQVQVKISPY